MLFSDFVEITIDPDNVKPDEELFPASMFEMPALNNQNAANETLGSASLEAAHHDDDDNDDDLQVVETEETLSIGTQSRYDDAGLKGNVNEASTEFEEFGSGIAYTPTNEFTGMDQVHVHVQNVTQLHKRLL